MYHQTLSLCFQIWKTNRHVNWQAIRVAALGIAAMAIVSVELVNSFMRYWPNYKVTQLDMLEVDAIETLEPEKDVVEWVNTIKDKLLA